MAIPIYQARFYGYQWSMDQETLHYPTCSGWTTTAPDCVGRELLNGAVLMDMENAAAAIALAVTNERANRIYHVADSEVLSEAERLSRVGQVAGWQGQVVPKEYLPEEWNLPYNIKHWFTDTTCIRQELGYSEVVHPNEA